MLQAFLITLVSGLLFRLVAKWLMLGAKHEAATTSPAHAVVVMEPSRNHRRLVLTCGLFLAPLGVIIMVGSWPVWQLSLFFGGSITIWGLLSIYALKRRFILSDDGIVSLSPWAGSTSTEWSQVQAVRFQKSGETIRVRVDGRERIVIPCSMTGMAQLEQYMRSHLRSEVLGNTFEAYSSYVEAL